MSRRKGFIFLLLLFAVTVLLRLPNFNRPLSKHHEYNTAVILINIESWRQSGGGGRYHFTPLLNFQHPGDKCPVDFPQVDTSGNILYMPFGAGWYVIPYFIYQVFHLPADVIYLQVINLFFNLAAVVLLFMLSEWLVPVGQGRRYEAILAICCLFMFSPGVLWYLGNGYVTTGIEMPFVFALLLVLLPMLQSSGEITPRRLIWLSLLIILLAYIDWFVIFISFVAVIWVFVRVRKDRKYLPLLLIIPVASIAGVALPFIQFASYIGFDRLLQHLEQQFLFRSITSKESFSSLAVLVIWNIATSYLPMGLLLAFAAVKLLLRNRKISFTPRGIIFLWIYGAAVLLYNLVFLQWSAVHEFALIPLSLLLAVLTARLMMMAVSVRELYIVLTCYLLVAGGQYYLINRPGRYSWSGASYDSYEQLGRQLKSIPEDKKIFMNVRDWSTVIDYYAGRNITPVPDMDSARAFMRRWGVQKGVWVAQKDYRLEKIVQLR